MLLKKTAYFVAGVSNAAPNLVKYLFYSGLRADIDYSYA